MQPLDEGCSISRVPIETGDPHKRQLIRVACLELTGTYQPIIHYDCIHNQIQAIHNRVCGVVVKPTPAGLALVRRAAARFAAHIPLENSCDLYALADRHGGAKGRRYREAADAYLATGLAPSDSFVKMFIKAERFNPLDKVRPDPRAIQFRSAKYCVALAQYLRPIEEHLYLVDFVSRGVPRTRNVAKGLNSIDRAELLHTKMSFFDNPIVVDLDASRFDKHVSEALLKIEHSVYLRSNPDPMFRHLLKQQLVNKCFSSQGIKYRVKGRRMSGDMNTAVGNVTIMLILLLTYCDLILELPRWDCLDDGDDALVILEEGNLHRFADSLKSTFETFGMSMKVGNPSKVIHTVEFCQARVIEYLPGKFKFVRDYRKVFSGALSGVRNWGNTTFRIRVLQAIGTCELVLGLGVPVLQEYALAILRNVGGIGVDPISYAPDGLLARARRDARHIGIKDLRSVKPSRIESCARESFELAFGMTVSEQLRVEARLREWRFNVTELHVVGSEWSFALWMGRQSSEELYHL